MGNGELDAASEGFHGAKHVGEGRILRLLGL